MEGTSDVIRPGINRFPETKRNNTVVKKEGHFFGNARNLALLKHWMERYGKKTPLLDVLKQLTKK